jgi:hypothetical protein
VLTHANGSVGGWIMNGASIASYGAMATPGWTRVVIEDLDGDGKSDVVWKDASGAYAASLQSGLASTASATLVPTGNGWNVMP